MNDITQTALNESKQNTDYIFIAQQLFCCTLYLLWCMHIVYIVNSVGCVTPSSLLIHVLKQIRLHFLLGIVTEGTAKYRSIFPRRGEGENYKADCLITMSMAYILLEVDKKSRSLFICLSHKFSEPLKVSVNEN